ncbi:MAG: glycosyltransferase family 2 protein [Candidatus Pacearchaeota archaeon]|nr:glycosyltransferase family 2 protein [Candidatus Pacearchaeota archaeon]
MVPSVPPLPKEVVYPVLIVGFFISFFYVFVLLQENKEKTPRASYFPKVAFVIPAKNVEKYIEKCIKCVLEQEYKNKIYIVVVNDASQDTTREKVESLMKKSYHLREIILLERKKSLGKKAPVVNTGLRYVLKNLDVELVAVLDADTFIEKDVLVKACSYFQHDDKIAAITCPLLPHKPKKFLEKMQYVEYVMAMFFRKLLSRINALCFTPAFSIFRTSFFKEAGLYNENTWTEDFDIALRVRSRFYKIIQIEGKAWFIAPDTWSKLRKERVRWAHGTFQALLKDYRYMISPKYGTVGTFFLPVTVLLGLALIMVAFMIVVYGIFSSFINLLHNLSLGWRPSLELKINLFDISVFLSDPRVILGFFALFLSILFLVFAQKYTRGKINLFYYFVFIIPFSWFLAYTQLEGLIRYIFKLKMTWGKMH